MASGLCKPVPVLPTKYCVVRGLASGQFTLARVPDSKHAFKPKCRRDVFAPQGEF
jgi:hypothetical protein